MDFADFADRVDAIEAESADLAITSLVADLFVDAGADLPVVARLLLGRVFPAWDSTTLDVGPNLCHEALARAAGPNVTADDVAATLADAGEIGAVAESLDLGGQQGLAAFGAAEPDPLTVAEVDDRLRDLAAAEGAGSRDHKVDVLFGLFNRTDPVAARYLARLVLSEMRIGVGEGTVRDAIAEAFDVPADDVERALQVTNDYGSMAVRACDEGEAGLAAAELAVGRPVQAMLAQTGTAADAVEAWESVAVETKFDGARVQIHHDPADETRVFSRNLEDVTDALPEIVEFVADLDVPVILDGEAIAVDDAGDPLPFQEVLRRFRRKHDVARMREEVTVEFRAFDCLHVDGTDLLDAPLLDRRERLSSVLSDGLSPLTVAEDVETIADHEATALDAGHEGIMLKNPESAYTPGKRGQNWLKRKPDVETLDLVVTGAEWGEGRRANHLGTFLLSARDEDEFATIGKVATGITDERLAELSDRLEPLIRNQEGTEVDIEPEVVFEVGYEEIQASSTYGSGHALRFPRFVAVREDKTPSEADSLSRIERLVDEHE
ncbi:ATP-dependent DNA ligase LigA [Haloplanus aerogenes]|uniref:DNA ligase n=1 Tax=Haloplanus aerogenes TaxID=660522 RepID=A0A3G8QTG7_9EURY|nr:ATP-dependent DNA ligase LigA [Haloplanus aerogenes]AZH25843.1 ATP-dependent DNA ligase [Haloplanus aerogenes]RMB25589.1 DNA ligase-1 [Haloplanus aerogenes]